jgi:DNA-binding CsgD family transcriptional regulator
MRVCGLVTGGLEGLDVLRQAVEVLARSPARLEHAKALIDFGAALRRAGNRGEARRHLRDGIALADVCGASPLVEQGREELRASGARPRRLALKGPGALTPSELRVARLAADGHSNRTIAQTLFVTPRTVEVHLTSVYRKLAVSGRGEVRNALGQA